MQVLLVFKNEDPHIVTLKNSILNSAHSLKCVRNIEETHDAFKHINYDLVFIDCRRQSTSSSGHRNSALINASSNQQALSQTTATAPTTNTTTTNHTNAAPYDYENVCRFIKKLHQYTIQVAIVSDQDEREIQSVLPFLKLGFNDVFKETTNLAKCKNALLTLEYGQVAMQRRLQAAHVLFTALEFTSDAIEIMNEQFKLLYVNNAFEKLTGQKLNQLSGQQFHKVHRFANQTEREIEKALYATLQSGKACSTSELPFRKADGQLIGTYPSLTIPVIVQGKTNKTQSYVNITRLPSDLETDANQNEANPLSNKVGKSINPIYLANRSYDFDHLASDLEVSNEPIELATSNQAVAVSKHWPNGMTSNIHSVSFNLEEKSDSQHELSALVSATTNMKSMSVDFTNAPPSPSASSSSPSALSIIANRKRSYDVHQPSYGHSVSTNSSFAAEAALAQQHRRHSTTRSTNQPSAIEAPIRKVINIITIAHEQSRNEFVRQNLDKALDILKSTELYNPQLRDKNDKHTSDLVSGLMSNGLLSSVERKNEHKQLFTSVSSLTSQNYVKNLSDEVLSLLEVEQTWHFDVIALERLTCKRPLVTLGLKTMNRFGVCEHLKIEENMLVNWLTLIESNYRPTNPYHNSTHASDVMHATAYFLSTPKLTEVFDLNDRVASLLAAAVHDLNHPGRTNAFLCNSNNDLALLYNDQAVLENHHVSLAFQLTRQNDDANIFKNLTRDEYRALRSIIIDMVLATEMSKHFEHLNKFINKFCGSDELKPVAQNTDNLKLAENKTLIKRIIIKCADISNPCRPLDIYKEWTRRVASEYFDQTDEEKARGLPVVLATYDRTSCDIPKSQITFIDYFMTDMFEALDELIEIPQVIANLQANSAYWRELAENKLTQDLLDLAASKQQQATGKDNADIFEDNENEEQKELTNEADSSDPTASNSTTSN